MKFETASRLFADCVASVDARRLYRLGLFGPTPETLLVQCPVDSADAPELEVRIAWDPAVHQVRLTTPGQIRGRSQAVAVGRRENPRGGGYYFVCPVAGERCEKLYFARGGWASRRAQRLSYSCQGGSLADRHRHSVRRLTAQLEASDRPPLSAERRVAIEGRIDTLERTIAALPRRAARTRPAPETFADLAPLARAAMQAAPATRTGRALATEAALDRAAALDDPEDTVDWLFHRADSLRRLVGRTPHEIETRLAGLRPDFVEDHPRISLRALQARGLVRPGWRRGAVLDWTGLGCGLDRCALVIDLRDEDLWFAGLEVVTGRDRLELAVRIVVAGDGELRFVCPINGAEVETLAGRVGVVAAAESLRLTRRPGRG